MARPGWLVQQPLISLTSTTPAAATASSLPSSALEELEIGLNVFNELDDADFSRYSSPTGEKYRSSSSETGRPAATPLRRGVCISSLAIESRIHGSRTAHGGISLHHLLHRHPGHGFHDGGANRPFAARAARL